MMNPFNVLADMIRRLALSIAQFLDDNIIDNNDIINLK